jgi:hypothetical protein
METALPLSFPYRLLSTVHRLLPYFVTVMSREVEL